VPLHASEQVLTFQLGSESYGIPLTHVQEISGYRKVTPLPNTPAWVLGAMNLRGVVVPLLDLRTRLGLPARDVDPLTVVIVVMLGERRQGLVVDSVADVLKLEPADVDAAPELGAAPEARFVSRLARAGDELVLLLDVARLLGTPPGAPAAPPG
jgi:purine-binding chemotaxis protein CheW